MKAAAGTGAHVGRKLAIAVGALTRRKGRRSDVLVAESASSTDRTDDATDIAAVLALDQRVFEHETTSPMAKSVSGCLMKNTVKMGLFAGFVGHALATYG